MVERSKFFPMSPFFYAVINTRNHLFSIVITLTPVLLALSCHHENETDYFISSKRDLVVTLGDAGFKLSNWRSFAFFQINQDGFPIPINGRYKDDNKKLSLELDLSLALGTRLSKADQITGISPETNTVLRQKTSWHGKTVKSLRFELRPRINDELVTQKVWYGQNLIPISQLELASNASEVKSKLVIKMIEVGFAKIYVVDAASNPIQGAKLTPILESTTDLGFGKVSLSLYDPYRPVRSETNIGGYSQVGPLYIEDDNSHFRVHAWAPGYCSYVSEPFIYSALGEKAPQIVLKTCNNQKGSSLRADFASQENVYQEFYDGQEFKVAYTNQDKLSLRIDHPMEIPNSGFTVRIYESFTYPFQSAPIFEHIYEKFESEVSIPTPIAFNTGSALNGSFSIEVSPISNSEIIQNDPVRLLAKKNIGKPGVEFIESIVISNNTGAKNIISGTDKGEFYISSALCKNGDSLGFSNNFQESFFSPCQESKAFFKSKDVKFFRDLALEGGYERIKIYLKDRYGNISDDDPEANNEKEIYIDYGEPTISSQSLKLGIQAGFFQANQISGSGTDLDPYIFSQDDPLIIQASQLQNYKFGFSKPANCKLSYGTSKDGDNSSSLGLEISGFSINPDVLNQIHTCKNSDSTKLIEIVDQMIEFPNEAEQSAKFKLKIIDSADNHSQVHTINIPACTQSLVPQNHICWSP